MSFYILNAGFYRFQACWTQINTLSCPHPFFFLRNDALFAKVTVLGRKQPIFVNIWSTNVNSGSYRWVILVATFVQYVGALFSTLQFQLGLCLICWGFVFHSSFSSSQFISPPNLSPPPLPPRRAPRRRRRRWPSRCGRPRPLGGRSEDNQKY